jgi:Bacterial PH domain
MSGEHEFEAVRGLPGDLPEGEKILWQGAPDWMRLSVDAFKIHWVGTYFAALIAWRMIDRLRQGTDPITSLTTAIAVVPLALFAISILCALAWVNSRSTVYSITDKRVVMRFGAALTKAINIPFKIIESASADVKTGGAGTVAIKLAKPNKIPLLLLWPHRKPHSFAHPEPAFRSIKDAATCAPILAEALRVAHAQNHAVGVSTQEAADTSSMALGAQPAMA